MQLDARQAVCVTSWHHPRKRQGLLPSQRVCKTNVIENTSRCPDCDVEYVPKKIVRKRLSVKQLDIIFDRTKPRGRCYICNCPLDFNKRSPCDEKNDENSDENSDKKAWHVDHFIPFKKAPEKDVVGNMLPCCWKCNIRKGAHNPGSHLQKYDLASVRIEALMTQVREIWNRLKGRPPASNQAKVAYDGRCCPCYLLCGASTCPCIFGGRCPPSCEHCAVDSSDEEKEKVNTSNVILKDLKRHAEKCECRCFKICSISVNCPCARDGRPCSGCETCAKPKRKRKGGKVA
mmetsp:Transcript_55575/g.92327  ORF Transcript_55575/g.92327 Transcript_55575/m.92327 type:complete len:289 (+) Transcript_55575:16-882(+)